MENSAADSVVVEQEERCWKGFVPQSAGVSMHGHCIQGLKRPWMCRLPTCRSSVHAFPCVCVYIYIYLSLSLSLCVCARSRRHVGHQKVAVKLHRDAAPEYGKFFAGHEARTSQRENTAAPARLPMEPWTARRSQFGDMNSQLKFCD